MEALKEARQAAIRAMVAEIGSAPMQDMHFDAWYYPGQSPEMFGLQRYEHSVIRQYLKLKGGESPSPALVAMTDYLMLDASLTQTAAA
jgi:hypothetical protein